MVVAALAGLAWIARARVGADRSKGEASEVRTATIATGDLQRTVRLSGVVTAERFAALMAPRLLRQPAGFGLHRDDSHQHLDSDGVEQQQHRVNVFRVININGQLGGPEYRNNEHQHRFSGPRGNCGGAGRADFEPWRDSRNAKPVWRPPGGSDQCEYVHGDERRQLYNNEHRAGREWSGVNVQQLAGNWWEQWH